MNFQFRYCSHIIAFMFTFVQLASETEYGPRTQCFKELLVVSADSTNCKILQKEQRATAKHVLELRSPTNTQKTQQIQRTCKNNQSSITTTIISASIYCTVAPKNISIWLIQKVNRMAQKHTPHIYNYIISGIRFCSKIYCIVFQSCLFVY